jgi:hypothetical protein
MISVDRFLKVGWDMPDSIFTLFSESTEGERVSFVSKVTSAAKEINITTAQIDFQQFASLDEAFQSDDWQQVIQSITDPALRSLVIFKNVDAMAQFDCPHAYTLRTILTTAINENVAAIFTAAEAAIHTMFNDSRAPFYSSHFPL